MKAFYPVLLGAVVLLLHAAAFVYLRWRSRRHRSYRLRSKDGTILQVTMLGPFRRGKGRGRK